MENGRIIQSFYSGMDGCVENNNQWIQRVQRNCQRMEGSVSITVNADPSKNVPEPVYMFTDYWHGDALEFLICDAAKAQTAKFVMSGDYSRWKQVAKKELDAT